jgi:uncharacterized protein YbcI
MAASAAEPVGDGQRARAISDGMQRMHREFYGRGATTARTVIQRDYVATFLEDVYAPAEKTLIKAGESESVKQARSAFQRAMEDQFIRLVEEAMGRKVIAFMSQVHFDPDISLEAFVLQSDDGQAPADAVGEDTHLQQPLPR